MEEAHGYTRFNYRLKKEIDFLATKVVSTFIGDNPTRRIS
jgi:hypothetical protein